MKFVAITACPTGIAHSQMAAENLETTATDRGHDIHVEVQGAMGTENEIPADTLAAADAVIVAADTGVQLGRFDDHIIVKGSVKDGVNDAGGLIDEAVRRVEDAAGASDAEADDDTAEPDATGGEPAASDEASQAASGEASTATGNDAADHTAGDDAADDDATSSGGLLATIRNLFS